MISYSWLIVTHLLSYTVSTLWPFSHLSQREPAARSSSTGARCTSASVALLWLRRVLRQPAPVRFTRESRRTTAPVWWSATTRHYSHCSTNTPRSLSLNQERTSTRHGTTASAGLLNQPRDVSSMPTNETIKFQTNRAAWRHQSKLLRSTLRRRYIDYWLKTNADNASDSKALWSKLNVLLKTTKQSSSAPSGHWLCRLLPIQGR